MRNSLAIAAIGAALAGAPAWAYRPYDSTDADTLEDHELEIELGWRDLTAPSDGERAVDAVFNYGIGHSREVILEGSWLRTPSANGGWNSSISDVALKLKQLHRRGVLQGERGLSIASECGVLIPTSSEESGPGGECTLIASHRNSVLSFHLDAGVAYETDHRWSNAIALVVEGQESWRWKPGLELRHEHVEGESAEFSALLGLTWRASNTLALDAAYRRWLEPSSDPDEWRIGMTWSH